MTVLKDNQRHVSLATQLDEMRSFDAVLNGDWSEDAENSDQTSFDVSEYGPSLEEGISVSRFELAEATIVDETSEEGVEVDGGGGGGGGGK